MCSGADRDKPTVGGGRCRRDRVIGTHGRDATRSEKVACMDARLWLPLPAIIEGKAGC